MSAGWVSPSSRGLWGGDALLLSTGSPRLAFFSVLATETLVGFRVRDTDLAIGILDEVHTAQQLLHRLLERLRWHPTDHSVEAQVFSCCHVGLDPVELRAVAHGLARFVQIALDGQVAHRPHVVGSAFHLEGKE